MKNLFTKKKEPVPTPKPEPPRNEAPRGERPKPDPPRSVPPAARLSTGSSASGGMDSMFSGMQVKQDAPAGGMFGGLQMNAAADASTPTSSAAKPSAFGFLPDSGSQGDGLSFAGLAIKDNAPKSETSGFNFTAAPPVGTSGGFNFVNTSAPPPAESMGFNFKEAAPSSGSTGGGFKFVEQSVLASSPGLDFAGLSIKNAPASESKDLDFAGLVLKNQTDSRRNSATTGSGGGELDFAGMTLKTSSAGAPLDLGRRGSARLSSSGFGADAVDAPLDFAGLSLKTASRRGSLNETDNSAETHTPSAAANSKPVRSSEASFAGLTFKIPGNQDISVSTGGFSFQAATSDPTPTPAPAPVHTELHPTATSSAVPAVAVSSTTATDSLEAVQAGADKVLIDYFEEVKSVLRAEQSTQQLETDLQETIQAANERLKTNEVAMTELIQLEDFEKADHLNALVEQDKLLIKQTETKLRSSQQSSSSQTSNTDSLITQVVSQIEKYQTLMSGFYREKQQQMETYVRTETNRLEEVEESLQLENDRIERALEHAKVDLDKVSEELSVIEVSIQADTKEVLLVKTQQEELKVKLDAELAELLRLLAEKQKEVVDNEDALAITNDKLAQARVGHEKKLKRLGETKSRMVEAQQGSLKEQETLNAKREALGVANARKEEQKQDYEQKLNDIEANRNQLAAFVVRLKAEQEAKRNVTNAGESEHAKRTATLRQELLASATTIDNLVGLLGEKELEVAQHQKIIMAADLRIPTLEAEKAAKITKRDFLGAGGLSKEIKDLQAAKSTSEETIKNLKSEIESCKTKQEETNANHSRLEVAIKESMVNADKATYQKLQLRRQTLEGLLASLPSVSSAVSQADRSCLELEISFTQAQLDSLRTKHNWSEETLPSLPSFSSTSSSSSSVSSSSSLSLSSSSDNETKEGQTEANSSNSDNTPAFPSSAPVSSTSRLSKEVISSLREQQTELNHKLVALEQSIEEALATENYEQAAQLDADLVSLKAELETLRTTLAPYPELGNAEDTTRTEEDHGEHDSDALAVHLPPSDDKSTETVVEPLSPKNSSTLQEQTEAVSSQERKSVSGKEAATNDSSAVERTSNIDNTASAGGSVEAQAESKEDSASSDNEPVSEETASVPHQEPSPVPDQESVPGTSEPASIDDSENIGAETENASGNIGAASSSQSESRISTDAELNFGRLAFKSQKKAQASPRGSGPKEPVTSDTDPLVEDTQAGSPPGGLAFGLNVKAPTTASEDGALDFDGLTVKQSAPPELDGKFDFGGLNIKAPVNVTEANGKLDFGGLTIKSPANANGST